MDPSKRDAYNKAYVDWALPYTQSYLKLESGKELSLKYEFLTSQLLFIREYLNFLFKDGISLRFVRAFLEKQTFKRNKSRYLVILEGGHLLPFFIAVDEMREIDLIDSKHITSYSRIQIYNKLNRRWSEEKANILISQIKKDDLEWQGDEAIITHSINKYILTLNVRVKDGDDGKYIAE